MNNVKKVSVENNLVVGRQMDIDLWIEVMEASGFKVEETTLPEVFGNSCFILGLCMTDGTYGTRKVFYKVDHDTRTVYYYEGTEYPN